jgi:hypothetical protein
MTRMAFLKGGGGGGGRFVGAVLTVWCCFVGFQPQGVFGRFFGSAKGMQALERGSSLSPTGSSGGEVGHWEDDDLLQGLPPMPA